MHLIEDNDPRGERRVRVWLGRRTVVVWCREEIGAVSEVEERSGPGVAVVALYPGGAVASCDGGRPVGFGAHLAGRAKLADDLHCF